MTLLDDYPKKIYIYIDDCPFSLPHIIAIPIPCLQEMDEEGHLIHNCVHI